MTVVEIRKVKNVLTQAGPKTQESVSLPGGLKLEFDKEAAPEINSTVSYYFGLRVLAYGWAWAGNFKQRALTVWTASSCLLVKPNSMLMKLFDQLWNMVVAAFCGCRKTIC